MWEHFHHQADIGVRGIGDTIEQAFEETALAMTAVVCSHEKVEAKEQIFVKCQADSSEMLLVDWLSAVIYEMDTRNMLFSKYEVKIDGTRLDATIWGEPIDYNKHEPAVDVKGATYMMLKVVKENEKWIAQCVVDV